MKKKSYWIIVGILSSILVIVVSILLIKGPVKVEDNKYGTEAKTYAKTFDLKLVSEDNEKYYIIKGLTTNYGQTLSYIDYPETIDGIKVTKIVSNENKFASYNNVKSINIPRYVNFIGLDDLSTPCYFDGATNLMEIMVSTDNELYQSISGVLYDKEGANLLKYPACKNSVKYEIIDTTIKIFNRAFYGSVYLTQVIFPNSLLEIGQEAFKNATKLATISFSIESKLKVISEQAFYNCQALSEVVLPDSLERLGSSSFAKNKNLVKLVIPSKIVTFGYNIISSSDNAYLYTPSDNYENLMNNRDHFSSAHNLINRIIPIE